MTERMEPRSCQFCGGRTEVVIDPRPQWLTWYVVICAEGDPCGAMGPARRTRDEAVIAFNTRLAPEENICLQAQSSPAELFAGLAEDGLMENIGYVEDMPAAPENVIEAMQDAFFAKIVTDGNGGIEFFDEGMCAAYAAAEEAWTRQVSAAWKKVADALDDIPGGMHAELEDAASAFADAIERREHLEERKE